MEKFSKRTGTFLPEVTLDVREASGSQPCKGLLPAPKRVHQRDFRAVHAGSKTYPGRARFNFARVSRCTSGREIGQGGRGAHARIRTGDLFLTKEVLVEYFPIGVRMRSNAEAIASNRCLAALPRNTTLPPPQGQIRRPAPLPARDREVQALTKASPRGF